MKNIFFILLTCFSIFSLNSCREDGEWGNENGGQFGFTIERDATFIEKAVGETNQLKFNIKPSYDFASIKTSFKFTTSLNGTLKLNGETLVANQEYNFSDKNNTFEYVGNVAGTHNLEISVKNSKGASVVEKFELKYSVSEFAHTFAGGTADIYQGDETTYTMKITPNTGQPSTGYQIKFNSYNGEVKLNGVPATLGTWYALNNIDNFTTTLKTNVAGQGVMTYSIKNSTVEKDYQIQQTIIQRKIEIESMSVSPLAVAPNAQITFTGTIKKTPVTTNNTISYKTWISSSSTGNNNGIQTTNNMYEPYALVGTNGFTKSFTAVAEGAYTINIQAKDEYGNESAIKSFDVNVTPYIYFEGTPTATGIINMDMNWPSTSHAIFKSLTKSLKVVAGNGLTISSIQYTITFNHYGQLRTLSHTENFTQQTVELTNNTTNYNTTYHSGNLGPGIPSSVPDSSTLKIKATASNGSITETIITLPLTMTTI